MLAIAFGSGLLIGLAAGAGLVRYGLGLGEKMTWGRKDGVPVLSRYDTPLEQSHTVGGEDEDLEVET